MQINTLGIPEVKHVQKKITHIKRHHLDRKKNFLKHFYHIPFSQNLNFCGVTLNA